MALRPVRNSVLLIMLRIDRLVGRCSEWSKRNFTVVVKEGLVKEVELGIIIGMVLASDMQIQ